MKNKNNIANKFSLKLDCNYFSCMSQSNFYLCEYEAEKEFCGENNNKSQSVMHVNSRSLLKLVSAQ